MRRIKTAALVLVTSLALGAGLTIVTANPAAGQPGQAAHVTLHTEATR